MFEKTLIKTNLITIKTNSGKDTNLVAHLLDKNRKIPKKQYKSSEYI